MFSSTYSCSFFNRRSDERDPILKQRDLPPSFFEPELEDNDVPEDVKVLLRNVRFLSYLDREVVNGLSQLLKGIHLKPDNYLYRTGDVEKNIYVVKSGQINIYFRERVGRFFSIDYLL